MGELEVEEDRHAIVDHDMMVMAHASCAFVVQMEVAGVVAAAVAAVLAGRQVTDIVAAALG